MDCLVEWLGLGFLVDVRSSGLMLSTLSASWRVLRMPWEEKYGQRVLIDMSLT